MSSACVQLLYVAIGVFMVCSLVTVTRATASLPHEQLCLKGLLIHAGAFVLFMLGAMSFALFFILYMFNYPSAATSERNLYAADLFNNICLFVSQCCLCQVFWQLSVKHDDLRASETSYSDVQTEDFDEEAEIMLEIWTLFVRTDETVSVIKPTEDMLLSSMQQDAKSVN